MSPLDGVPGVSRLRGLAAAQTVPVRGDLAANLDQHVELARVAAAEGARIVVFPELSLTGYELDLAPDLALAEDDARLGPLVETARSSGATLIVGAPVRIESRLQIGAFVLSPEGPSQVYTKRHLGSFSGDVNPDGPVPPAEATVFEPGAGTPVVPFGETKAAIAICADARQPSHIGAAARAGARACFVSMFVIPPDFREDTERLRRYAELHSMPVVFSNYGGPSGKLPSAGCRAIWSDSGEQMVQLESAGPGVPVAVNETDGWRAAAIMLDD